MLIRKHTNLNKLNDNDFMINLIFHINKLQCPYMEKMHTFLIIFLKYHDYNDEFSIMDIQVHRA